VILSAQRRTNLRAAPACGLSLVDASSRGIAAVHAPLEAVAADESTRFCLRKGRWAQLLSQEAAYCRERHIVTEEFPGQDPFDVKSWSVELVECLPFKVVSKSATRGREHINLGELRASWVRSVELQELVLPAVI
jgi:hypothetical protein